MPLSIYGGGANVEMEGESGYCKYHEAPTVHSRLILISLRFWEVVPAVFGFGPYTDPAQQVPVIDEASRLEKPDRYIGPAAMLQSLYQNYLLCYVMWTAQAGSGHA